MASETSWYYCYGHTPHNLKVLRVEILQDSKILLLVNNIFLACRISKYTAGQIFQD